MNSSDAVRFMQLMTALAEDCSATVSKPGLMLRFDALKQYSIEQVEVAVMHVMQTNVYNRMPTTGTITQAIEQTDTERAESQVKAIRDEIRRVGSYAPPRFEDPVTDSLVRRRFGWGSICAMTEKDFDFFVRSFKDAYASEAKEVRIDKRIARLTGQAPSRVLPAP